MNARCDEPMFEVAPRDFGVGDRVIVQTIWGEEPGTVRLIEPRAGEFPIAMCDMDMGDTVSIQLARIRKGCCQLIYRCPTSKTAECPVHGGFDVCCDDPSCPSYEEKP